ncbi:sulfatase-like hydrolase/transferase [Streptomyces sp. NPDC018045]|uniref:sulfatase-like hydrolase/transferase n=1 Tax=Streptomyces sp. NPDC018045 TaxID=3365037 RepID=UPI0037BA3020
MSVSQPYDHVVFISLDCLRSDGVGANPHKLWPLRYPDLRAPATPVLDDLANSGTFFGNVIASAPYTSAAHATVFTGQYPARHGLHAFYEGFLRSPSVFTHARRAGRRTIMKVDFPVILGEQLGFTADIDTYLVEEDQKFIDAVLATETSLSLAHFAGMHMPYGFHNLRFGGSAYQEKIAWMESLLPAEVPHQVDELNETYRTPADMALFLRYKRAINYLYAAGQYDTLFQMYLDGIEFFLKSRFEPFLTQLVDRVRQAGKTLLLVLFGDHGQQFEDDSYGNFNSMEEGVLRIPLIIAGDGVAQGRHLRRIRSADIAPTVMELAGIDVPWRGLFDGESRADVVRGATGLTADAPALAQAYTSDARQFVHYQKRQRAGEDPGALPHVLLGETAYLDRTRLVRLHYRYTDQMSRLAPEERVWTERFDDMSVPQVQAGSPDPRLLAVLDDYNRALRPSRNNTPPESVRQGLRSLGYPL